MNHKILAKVRANNGDFAIVFRNPRTNKLVLIHCKANYLKGVDLNSYYAGLEYDCTSPNTGEEFVDLEISGNGRVVVLWFKYANSYKEEALVSYRLEGLQRWLSGVEYSVFKATDAWCVSSYLLNGKVPVLSFGSLFDGFIRKLFL